MRRKSSILTVKKTLNCRADSFVVKKNVHFPTDISLLYDAMRKIIQIVVNPCKSNNIQGFRQYKNNYSKLKKLMHRASKSKKCNKQVMQLAHNSYIECSSKLLKKAQLKLELIKIKGVIIPNQEELMRYQFHAITFINQIYRRIIKEEIIPHKEKIFSIFQPHTEWISKGKAGILVEFGMKLTVVQDQHQFILHQNIMEKQQDVHIAVKLADTVCKKYDKVNSISFDRGYWSCENEIEKLVPKVVMPKKGYCSKERKIIETTKEFKKLRYKHSAVKSGINDLQVHGLHKVLDHGIHGYKRYIYLGILGHNIHRLGSILLHKYSKYKKLVA